MAQQDDIRSGQRVREGLVPAHFVLCLTSSPRCCRSAGERPLAPEAIIPMECVLAKPIVTWISDRVGLMFEVRGLGWGRGSKALSWDTLVCVLLARVCFGCCGHPCAVLRLGRGRGQVLSARQHHCGHDVWQRRPALLRLVQPGWSSAYCVVYSSGFSPGAGSTFSLSLLAPGP